ncbi:NPCBM/NEW2 domain-containing protein [Clostridium sp. 1001271B_151109_B4]|uniref:NPCBM/NEW2 domain-containing protein n=1 Tax=Clostridium sp. 1001271B_151109_B4 TaxID=2787148 RepID=UPI0018AC444C|nr:NPCBM/NEW2 domain-containing protein [Clostridium sp. 1001271B_151109_B4]
MNRKKISALVLAALITNFSSQTIEVLADEISRGQIPMTESTSVEKLTQASISKFNLYNSNNLNAYNEAFKMDNNNIISITNNGGNYQHSTIDKSIDGDFNTHWETGKANSSEFTNEVIFKLNEVTTLNRIVYAARQSSAKGKGFAKEVEIYGSLTDEEDDFRLVSSGSYTGSTGDIVEIKFSPTEFKRIKFKFKVANQDWASASEFMFYKEDLVSDKIKNLFTDNTMSQVSEEFSNIEKISELEEEAKNHPLYSEFKEDIENAKLIVENKEVNYIDAKVSKFKDMNSETLPQYDAIYKVPSTNIKSITTNGGQYADNSIDKAIDGDLNTKWHSGKQNSTTFINEVIIELNELTKLNRIVYTAPRGSNRGFAEQFDIYASRTSKGDTFELVSSGSSKVTQDSIEIRFNPTEFRRVKFVFKKGYENWACAAEFGLYTQDEIAEKMDRLFTDGTMSIVSEEFNTLEKVQALEEDAKSHPFYEYFKEHLEDAKMLLQENQIEATKAITKQFKYYSNEEYSNLFKMDNENIKSIRNNAGNYGSAVITNAVDGNLDTYWETNKSNTNDFTNEVEVEFKEAVELNRVVYGARKSDSKGFAKEFEIYGSTTSKGDTYQLVATGSQNKVSGLVEAKFNTTEFKRIKFKFKNSDQNWATLSEIAFYKQDVVSDKVDDLFTNGLMNELKTEYNSMEAISKIEEEVNNHPLKEALKIHIEIAKDILNNVEVNNESIVIASQRGNANSQASKYKIARTSFSLETFGRYVVPGETIQVFVDADENGVMPKLVLGQIADDRNGWVRRYSLNPGLNTITAPPYDNMKPAVVYIENGALPNEQAYAPRVRLVGGTAFPVYYHGKTNPEEFERELEKYVEKISTNDDDFSNGVPKNVVYNVAELVSENNTISTSAAGALKGIKELKSIGKTVSDTMDEWELMWKEFQKISGNFENNSDPTKFYNAKFTSRVFTKGPYGWSDWGYTGYNGGNSPRRDGGFFKNIVKPISAPGNDSWAYYHEWGHSINSSSMEHSEVTNNIYSVIMRKLINNSDADRVDWNSLYKRFSGEKVNHGYWTYLGILEQVQYYYGEDTYAKASNIARINPDGIMNGLGGNLERLVIGLSLATETDLTTFFEDWGYVKATDKMKEKVSHLPKPNVKLEYMNTIGRGYEGNGFSKDAKVDIQTLKINKENEEISLTYNIDAANKDASMGYEILRDGEVVGYTTRTSFVDKNIDINKNYTYKIVAYDKKLNPLESEEISSFSPSINIQQNKITLGLGEEFNPLDYIKVLSYEGNDIISKIEVEHNVDTSQKGIYQVKYTVSDESISVEKIVEVEVVSDYEYLSDSEWSSAETQWGTPRRNSNIKGRVNGEVKDFEKGFGIHANGTIIYDLSGKDYDKFEALLGVDAGISPQNNSSIKFEIQGDGKVLAATEVLKHADNMAYINVPVKGVEQLVIKVTDAGNGNTSDHAVIANPKLTTNNAKPVITASDKVYKIGEAVDFNEDIGAVDAEDGDLTSNIEIISNSYEEGKVGRFEVVYRVTDSDNNTTEKKSYITVYEDYTVVKSKYGQYDNLSEYNEQFKIPVASITNNGGRYSSSLIDYAIDNNRNTHWETGTPNSSSFKNEVVFDLGETTEISRIAYAARNGGKGFARMFEVYVSTEAEGNDFILAGKGEYRGNVNDVVEFKIAKTSARRVKFKFIEANQDWASIGEMSFYKEDILSDKIENLFTDNTKTDVNEIYNTLEKVQELREEVKDHPAINLFEEDLKKAEDIIIAKFPTIMVEDITYVKLNSEFDLTSGVTANDQEDGDITSNVTVNEGNFNINKAGKYTLTYTVEDSNGNVVTKDRDIVVYSESTYLSDIEWQSAVSGWRTVNKDSAVNSSNKIKLKVNGEVREFDKGIGAATNAEIIYELDGNYSNFSTYLGTDKNYNDNRTTIIFRIFADGDEIYTSDVIRRDSEAEFVNLDVTGVKELKLVADDADGSGLGDFTSWADTKLYTTNAKPKLTIPKSISTKVGQEIDLNQEYSAIDSEDGDLTSNVEVTGEVNFNKPGKYSVTYRVIDSDGNEVVETRNIAVVNMEDYKYLTEYDWKSANSGWETVRKDASVSNNRLTLTNEEGQAVTYDRGIGTHATSTIIYDLSDKDYAYFTSFVGVDRAMYGRAGSISFEVYVDGEKKFDSGIMNSRDPQKHVEIDINGAKELKLVVTDGGNGIASDHATWGDSKLHYANSESIDYTELSKLVESSECIDREVYTEESLSILDQTVEKATEMIENKGATYQEIQSMLSELKDAIDNLERIDLNKIIEIEDKYLKQDIQKALGLSGDITLKDMLELRSLTCSSRRVTNLKGIEYAKNLEELNIEQNEVRDLSPLRDLKNLKVLNARLQIIEAGMATVENNKVILKERIVSRSGEILLPKEIMLRSEKLELENSIDENGNISIDTSQLEAGLYGVYITYENPKDSHEVGILYLFNVN